MCFSFCCFFGLMPSTLPPSLSLPPPQDNWTCLNRSSSRFASLNLLNFLSVLSQTFVCFLLFHARKLYQMKTQGQKNRQIIVMRDVNIVKQHTLINTCCSCCHLNSSNVNFFVGNMFARLFLYSCDVGKCKHLFFVAFKLPRYQVNWGAV